MEHPGWMARGDAGRDRAQRTPPQSINELDRLHGTQGGGSRLPLSRNALPVVRGDVTKDGF
jgi:hypothetical protein